MRLLEIRLILHVWQPYRNTWWVLLRREDVGVGALADATLNLVVVRRHLIFTDLARQEEVVVVVFESAQTRTRSIILPKFLASRRLHRPQSLPVPLNLIESLLARQFHNSTATQRHNIDVAGRPICQESVLGHRRRKRHYLLGRVSG